MALRAATWLAVAIGGTCGTIAALVGSASPPPAAPSEGLPMRPIGEIATMHSAAPASAAHPSAAPVNAPTPKPPIVGPAASVSAAANVAAGAVVGAAAAPFASGSGSALSASRPAASAEAAPLPDSKEALLRSEMHCDQKDAAACIVAARGYEAGSAGSTDLDKASKYRKIALTLWISQCDHNSAVACATLADMYRTGRGVPQNDKNADALIQRTRELCHYNDAPVCHDLPSP